MCNHYALHYVLTVVANSLMVLQVSTESMKQLDGLAHVHLQDTKQYSKSLCCQL
jgi:hypothetical protein